MQGRTYVSARNARANSLNKCFQRAIFIVPRVARALIVSVPRAPLSLLAKFSDFSRETAGNPGLVRLKIAQIAQNVFLSLCAI